MYGVVLFLATAFAPLLFGVKPSLGIQSLKKRLPMNQVLLLVDIQNDYFPGGAMELVGSPTAGAQAGKLLHAFREKTLRIIHIQHISTRPGATFFLPNTKGVEFHESVTPHAGETVFQKNYPNSFRETPLLEYLRQHQVTRLVIAGMMTQMCIDTTTRAAADLGFQCVLAYDACAAKSLSFGSATVSADNVQTAFIAALNGLFAQVLSVEEICANL
jgi:nicotinamidase-related amidase